MKWRSLGVATALTTILATVSVPAFAQKTKVTIYTALENDQLGPYKTEIEKAVPEAEVEWVREGIIVRLDAPGDADAVARLVRALRTP